MGAALTNVQTALPDYKKSGGVTNVVVGLPELAGHRRLATPTTTNANGISCINATSSSGNHFYYNSKIGGLTTTACPTDQ